MKFGRKYVEPEQHSAVLDSDLAKRAFERREEAKRETEQRDARDLLRSQREAVKLWEKVLGYTTPEQWISCSNYHKFDLEITVDGLSFRQRKTDSSYQPSYYLTCGDSTIRIRELEDLATALEDLAKPKRKRRVLHEW